MRVLRPQGLSGAVALPIGAAVLLTDLLTKRWASSALVDGGSLVVIPHLLSFRYVENPGAAFSLFENAGPFLGMAAVVGVAVVMWILARPRPAYEIIAFGLIIGAALGNLTDRIFRGEGFLDGKVIDWIQLSVIPTFNIADASINVAVAILLLGSWKGR
jgi:signal peptidase II